MRSLVVDDEMVCRMMLSGLLAPHGECDAAANGEEALAKYKEAIERGTPYDLICLDIRMPGMGGQDVLKQIRADEASRSVDEGDAVKVIMTTAMDDPDNVIDAYRSRCDIYLNKPIEADRLQEELVYFSLVPAEASK
jgi:two-component system chemotaxis response regulator CheY